MWFSRVETKNLISMQQNENPVPVFACTLDRKRKVFHFASLRFEAKFLFAKATYD